MKSKLERFTRLVTFTGLMASLHKKPKVSPTVVSEPAPVNPSPPSTSRPPSIAVIVGGDDKQAKSKAKSDEDSIEEMHGNSVAAAARRRERARCAAIMGCEAAAKNPSLAAGLAFQTRLRRREAIQFLESLPIEAQVQLPPPKLKGPSLVRINPQQVADQRLRLAISQANYERGVR